MARYRRIDVRIHFDQRVERLSPIPPCGEGLWHYLLTNPDGTMVPGLARCGRAAMAEALDWDPKAFDKAFGEVFREGLAKADWKARVVWVPNVIRYDPPGNPNVVRGWAPHWDEIPDCPLKAEAWDTLHAWFVEDAEAKSLNSKVQNPKAFLEAFLEACPKPFMKPSAKPSRMRALRIPEIRIQEQEEEKKFAPRPLVSAPPEPPSDPLLFEFPCDGEERTWRLRASKVAEWQESFPSLDVLAQCRQALQYVRDNPAKRKTARGMPAFLGRWLARSQNSHGNGSTNGAARRPTRNADRPPDEARLAALRERDRLARWDPDAVDQPEPSPPGAETPAEVLWSKAREKLKSSMDREEFFNWVAPIVPVPGDRPVVWCPSGRAAATVQEIYGAAIQEAAGGPVEVIHG